MYAVTSVIEGLEISMTGHDSMESAVAKIGNNSRYGVGSELRDVETGELFMWIPAYSSEEFITRLLDANRADAHV